MNLKKLQKLAQLIRYYILVSTTAAGSGHPTSSFSATDLMTTLLFDGHFHFDLGNPDFLGNDRLIFSKGHASPLFYALYLGAGVVSPAEIMTLRRFDSRLEGHPTARFPYTEAATGSLGQGLSVGVGMALALRRKFEARSTKYEMDSAGSPQANSSDKNSKVPNFDIRYPNFPKVYVLLGDGEMAEGSVWEAINIASHYQLDNLVAIVDVNRLGQSQETILGWDVEKYQKRFEAFGWETVVIDGHDYGEIEDAFRKAISVKDTWKVAERLLPGGGNNKALRQPFAIIAKTVKGKGVSFLENKEGWHGKPVPPQDLDKALTELGRVDMNIRGKIAKPDRREISNFKFQISNKSQNSKSKLPKTTYKAGEHVATRKAYGTALARLGEVYPNIISLDAEVKNSTYAEIFKEKFPDRFFEMFIAEQNMVGAAVGMARLGYIPFVSSFACFLTRGFDQMRMAALSSANIKFCGSHAGVSIGEDGPSQMGLEDLSMFRSLLGSVVLYPADAVATEKLVEEMIRHQGISYMRTSRPATPVIYNVEEDFPIGGSKIHKSKLLQSPKGALQNNLYTFSSVGAPQRAVILNNRNDYLGTSPKHKVIIVAAGVTLFEALKAQEKLAEENREAIVIDCYSVKPIDEKGLMKLVSTLKQKSSTPIQIVTVEDHWYEGGLGDAVLNVFSTDRSVAIHKLAVTKLPRSGKPAELLDYEGISAAAIIAKIKSLLV